jgi:1,4-dihydroxy-2-naphthoyl-CoA hydrolase
VTDIPLSDMPLGELATTMGVQFVKIDPDCVIATMPVEGNRQPYGLLHGGASAVLAETVGSVAAALNAGLERIAVGVDLSCTHHRAVRSGTVTATATPLHRGGSIATYDIRIVDEEDRPVCTARLTCAVRSTPPGSANATKTR